MGLRAMILLKLPRRIEGRKTWLHTDADTGNESKAEPEPEPEAEAEAKAKANENDSEAASTDGRYWLRP